MRSSRIAKSAEPVDNIDRPTDRLVLRYLGEKFGLRPMIAMIVAQAAGLGVQP
jgi:hypothetical protein